MNKKNIAIVSVSGLALLAAVLSIPYFASAANTTGAGNGQGRGMMFQNLTDEQKAAVEKEQETRLAERKARQEATDKAIEAGDYDAWIKAVGENSPLASKINKDNFSKFTELHNLQKQVNAKAQELGLEGMGKGFGGFGGGRHMGSGCPMMNE